MSFLLSRSRWLVVARVVRVRISQTLARLWFIKMFESNNKNVAFFTLMSAGTPIHVRLHYAAISPQLVQARMNRRACQHNSKKC